ncbi:hypothetical protein V5P93_002344 [Actinokineospora auranticolor]|uniref:Uncharacterized protein n=1 Tax=Actinokineospora auranticolor TaxID=155976 RepID=A0A2S6GDS5_9PSEU|nr:hypothetical protein [Actinokineospora auranticolor]PPK63375.1 hypothetical protein CLV40_12988 [Actinokineospora auranticolor]
MTDIPTVGDLVAALIVHDPDSPVRVASQPGHPMEHLLARVAVTPDDDHPDPPVVWLGIGDPIGHPPPSATDALGWTS